MGFQHMHEVVRKAAQRKGGKIRTAKGLAKMSPEKVREITSLGGKAKHGNINRKGAEQTQESIGGGYTPVLADVLGDIDEQLSK